MVLGLQQGPGLLVVVVVVGPLGPLGVVVEEVQGVETFEVGGVEQVLGEDEQLGPPDFSPVVVVVASINLLGVVPFRQPQLLLPNKIKQKLIKLIIVINLLVHSYIRNTLLQELSRKHKNVNLMYVHEHVLSSRMWSINAFVKCFN